MAGESLGGDRNDYSAYSLTFGRYDLFSLGNAGAIIRELRENLRP